MGFFDNLIGFFSPNRKLRRLADKKAHQILAEYKRKYEGAGSGRRFSGWITSGGSANSEVGASLSVLRNRSRDLIRNNPYASRAQKVLTSNIVGTGIKPSIKVGQSEDSALMSEWREWAETTECDHDGRLDFYGIQDLVSDAEFESGEVFVRRRISRGSRIPFKLQVLESDFVPTHDKIPVRKGHRVIHGVEFNADGKRVAYHFYRDHPGNIGLFNRSTELVRVPADEVLHIGHGSRPGQVRFVPRLAPVMLKLRDFDEYEDAQLVRQKIAACYTAFIQDNPAIQHDLDDDEREDLGEKLEPGAIEFLPPGKEITLPSPPTVENYSEYTSVVLHSIAAGLNISFEALTGILSEVNFSSARMGWLEMHRYIQRIRARIIDPQLNNPVLNWFLLGLRLSGVRVSESVTASWTAPRREMIDPTKEIPASIKAVRSGISSLSDVVRATGKHPAEHFRELSEDYKLIDKYGLILDSDARRTASNGAHQNGEANDEE